MKKELLQTIENLEKVVPKPIVETLKRGFSSFVNEYIVRSVDLIKVIDDFVSQVNSPSRDGYMTFFVSYYYKKTNKLVDKSVSWYNEPKKMDEWLERYNILLKDLIECESDIIEYCFDYENHSINVVAKDFERYVLNKKLLDFCFYNLSGIKNLRIPQCALPTFLFNYPEHNFRIEYSKFDENPRLMCISKMLEDIYSVKQQEYSNDSDGSLLISPRIYNCAHNKVGRTDTELIKEELEKIKDEGILYVLLPKEWINEDEEAKKMLISRNNLKKIICLPPYKNIGVSLAWLCFDKSYSGSIEVYESSMYDNIDKTEDVECRKLNSLIEISKSVTWTSDDFIERAANEKIQYLYKDYIDIIERRFAFSKEKKDEIKESIINKVLIPLHSNRIEELNAVDVGRVVGRDLLDIFFLSVENENLISKDDSSKLKSSLDNKINYLCDGKVDIKDRHGNVIETLERKESFTIDAYVKSILTNIRMLGNLISHHNNPYFYNQLVPRVTYCGYGNIVVSWCFDFLDLLKWYDTFLTEKKNAEECRRIKEEEKDTNQQVTKNILSKSEKLVDYDASSASNILQTEFSDKNDDLQEPLMSSIQQDEEAEDCTTLDTNESLNVELKSPECHQADIPQEDKGSDTIEARNSPPTNDNKKTYIVKSFKNRSGNTFRYIEYESRNALFDIEASVEEGDEIILMKVPIINSIDSLKLNYPLYIPKYSYKKVNK